MKRGRTFFYLLASLIINKIIICPFQHIKKAAPSASLLHITCKIPKKSIGFLPQAESQRTIMLWLVEKRKNLSLWLNTNGLIHNLAILHSHKGWDAHYAECTSEFGLFVNVDFANLDFRMFFCNLFDYRTNHAAWPAPGCPEIHQNRLFWLKYLCFKILWC